MLPVKPVKPVFPLQTVSSSRPEASDQSATSASHPIHRRCERTSADGRQPTEEIPNLGLCHSTYECNPFLLSQLALRRLGSGFGIQRHANEVTASGLRNLYLGLTGIEKWYVHLLNVGRLPGATAKNPRFALSTNLLRDRKWRSKTLSRIEFCSVTIEA